MSNDRINQSKKIQKLPNPYLDDLTGLVPDAILGSVEEENNSLVLIRRSYGEILEAVEIDVAGRRKREAEAGVRLAVENSRRAARDWTSRKVLDVNVHCAALFDCEGEV